MHRRIIGLTAAALLALTAGCSASGSGSARSGMRQVKIGSVNSLTGTFSSSGGDVQEGEELAAEIINGKFPNLQLPLAAGSGLPALGGAKIDLITQDDQGSPETAANAVTQLVTQDNVAAIVGGYASSVTATASSRAERLQIPFVNGSSSAGVLTTRGLKWFFRVGPTDERFAQTMFGLLQQEAQQGKKVSRIAILHTNDTYGNGVEAVTKTEAQKAGYQVVADVAYDHTTNDMTPEILKLKAAQPDVVFDSSYTSDSLLLMRGLQSLHWYPQALLAYGAGFSDPTFVPTLQSAANGAMSRAAWSSEIPKKSAQMVAQMFKQKFNRDMTENSARGFSSLMAVAVAVNNAKSTDPSKIRSSLENLNIPGGMLIEPWSGIKFGSDHQNTGASGLVQQVQNGQYRIVFPSQYAVAKVVWPMTGAK